MLIFLPFLVEHPAYSHSTVHNCCLAFLFSPPIRDICRVLERPLVVCEWSPMPAFSFCKTIALHRPPISMYKYLPIKTSHIISRERGRSSGDEGRGKIGCKRTHIAPISDPIRRQSCPYKFQFARSFLHLRCERGVGVGASWYTLAKRGESCRIRLRSEQVGQTVSESSLLKFHMHCESVISCLAAPQQNIQRLLQQNIKGK